MLALKLVFLRNFESCPVVLQLLEEIFHALFCDRYSCFVSVDALEEVSQVDELETLKKDVGVEYVELEKVERATMVLAVKREFG